MDLRLCSELLMNLVAKCVRIDAMERQIRDGFDVENKLTLDQENAHGLVLDATPAERLAMVWPMTESCWAMMPEQRDNVQQGLQRHIVSVVRGKR